MKADPPAVEHKGDPGDREARERIWRFENVGESGGCVFHLENVTGSCPGDPAHERCRMRIKVELHEDVVWFVKHRCSVEEVAAFYAGLEDIRREPISNSESIADPNVSEFMLRFFRFRRNIAIFEYDIWNAQIRVLECQKPKPSRKPRSPGRDVP